MVVWIFAGGGYAEAEFNKLLQLHLNCFFIRKLPIGIKPAARWTPNAPSVLYAGYTGNSLALEIRKQLSQDLSNGERCDAIVILDDTDADDPTSRQNLLESVVHDVFKEIFTNQPMPPYQVFTALAIPEIETWILSDWQHTIQQEYGNCHQAVLYSLSQSGVCISVVEEFLQSGGIYRKLSEVLIEAMKIACAIDYSKSRDTPRLLLRIDPHIVATRCSGFRSLFYGLKAFCGNISL